MKCKHCKKVIRHLTVDIAKLSFGYLDLKDKQLKEMTSIEEKIVFACPKCGKELKTKIKEF